MPEVINEIGTEGVVDPYSGHRLICGEGGIRTLVTCFHVNSLSRGALSATQPPLQSMHLHFKGLQIYGSSSPYAMQTVVIFHFLKYKFVRGFDPAGRNQDRNLIRMRLESQNLHTLRIQDG